MSSESERFESLAHLWNLEIRSVSETASSIIGYADSGDGPVVLKVVRQVGDEWHAGSVLEAMAGPGVVRVHKHVPGAMLIERLIPGTPLVTKVLAGEDSEATQILANVVCSLTSCVADLPSTSTVEHWGKGFDRYEASGDSRIPADLVRQARDTYRRLAATQQDVRLLHGDLQHYNVLLDSQRGWVAIDPKGVIGEVEFELGAILRNPNERPQDFASHKIVACRIDAFQASLNIDSDRVLGWTFAQAVLSAIWLIEDGLAFDPTVDLSLACIVRKML